MASLFALLPVLLDLLAALPRAQVFPTPELLGQAEQVRQVPMEQV